MFEFIQVTAQYSNAVLVAILPQLTEFSQKLDLPIQVPITLEQVERFNCDPHRGQVGGWLRLTNGFEFWYAKGYVTGFELPGCWYGPHQWGEDLEQFYGSVKMSAKEAVQLGRDSLQKLGYSETALYANGTPKITKPPIVRSKVVPCYRVEWIKPDGGISLDMEIDAEHKQLKSMKMSNNNLARDPPPVSVEPQPLTPGQVPDFMKGVPDGEKLFQQLPAPPRLTPQQDQAVLVAILPLISDYARKLDLPICLPVTTNQVSSFDTQFFPNETYLNLTNGYQFVYCRGYVQQFRAPYSFLGGYDKLDGRIEDYWGTWRMSERAAIKLARETIKKLGLSLERLHLDSKPEVKKPVKIGSNDIPRYRLNWTFSIPGTDDQPGGIVSATEVEVDAEKKCVKSVAIYDHNLVRPPPDIFLISASSTNLPPHDSTPQFRFLTNAPAKPPPFQQ